MKTCYVYDCKSYDVDTIESIIDPFINVKQGDRVFIKPNWVIEPWKGEEKNWMAYTTNGVFVEATLRCLKRKMMGIGTVILGDAPMHRSNFNKINELNGIPEILKRLCDDNFRVTLIDLRSYYFKYIKELCVNRIELEGDPLGTKHVGLGKDSVFNEKKNKNWAFYDSENNVNFFHNETDNTYDISASILSCDVFINIPKLKTHKSAGITCAMKNLVGTIGNKDCFPHRTIGFVEEGGDDIENSISRAIDSKKGLRSLIRKILKKKNPIINYALLPAYLIFSKIVGSKEKEQVGYDGGWYGNDTVWRGIIDLNRVIIYADKNGCMHETPQRRYLCIVDAIVAGEGFGPLHPIPKNMDKILISDNAVAADLTAATLMGYDFNKIPFLREARRKMRWPLLLNDENVEMKYGDLGLDIESDEIRKYIIQPTFEPAPGWINHIEKE